MYHNLKYLVQIKHFYLEISTYSFIHCECIHYECVKSQIEKFEFGIEISILQIKSQIIHILLPPFTLIEIVITLSKNLKQNF